MSLAVNDPKLKKLYRILLDEKKKYKGFIKTFEEKGNAQEVAECRIRIEEIDLLISDLKDVDRGA